jgi:hypothetical protein
VNRRNARQQLQSPAHTSGLEHVVDYAVYETPPLEHLDRLPALHVVGRHGLLTENARRGWIQQRKDGTKKLNARRRWCQVVINLVVVVDSDGLIACGLDVIIEELQSGPLGVCRQLGFVPAETDRNRREDLSFYLEAA